MPAKVAKVQVDDNLGLTEVLVQVQADATQGFPEVLSMNGTLQLCCSDKSEF